jgi:hypothetical protein
MEADSDKKSEEAKDNKKEADEVVIAKLSKGKNEN